MADRGPAAPEHVASVLHGRVSLAICSVPETPEAALSPSHSSGLGHSFKEDQCGSASDLQPSFVRAANSGPSTFLPRPGQPQGSASRPAPQGCAAPSPGPSLEPIWTGKHLRGRAQTPNGWRASTWREEECRRLAPPACAAPPLVPALGLLSSS